jgi:Flp pilus assembly pilin Flp
MPDSARCLAAVHLGCAYTWAVVIRWENAAPSLICRAPQEHHHEKVRSISLEQSGRPDIAEYAVMLAVILVLVVGTIRLVGSNANNTFSSVASAIQ